MVKGGRAEGVQGASVNTAASSIIRQHSLWLPHCPAWIVMISRMVVCRSALAGRVIEGTLLVRGDCALLAGLLLLPCGSGRRPG